MIILKNDIFFEIIIIMFIINGRGSTMSYIVFDKKTRFSGQKYEILTRIWAVFETLPVVF